jgi:FlaA1/EpsC-like NDP-sugar epimerase
MKLYITGITGTLGRAFTELLYEDHELYGVDHNEERLTLFTRDFPNVKLQIGDFADVDLEDIDTVIHLAAMKHIDFCEKSPNACVMNNVLKTHVLFKTARYTGTDILFMSTDKAVEPTSVYGYSKALGEAMAWEYGGAYARSGNILASTGSVLNVWEEAIRRKRPIRITHKDMHRYFVTPENLAKRVWTAYLNGDREIVPKMDKDIKIVDLAEEKLSEHGYTLETYPYGIEYTGLRPGEKLREKLEW